MNPLVFVAVAVIAIVLLPRLCKFISTVLHVLKLGASFPGPPALPLIGNALQIPLKLEDWGPYFDGLVNEYIGKGDEFLRLWVAHCLKIFPLTGKAVKDIIDSNEEITKADDYDVMKPWLGVGLLISTGDKWRSRRRMLTPTFHFAMLDGYVETMDRESRLLTEILDPLVEKEVEVDMFSYVKRCALDIICETAMGFQLNSQRDKANPYAVAVDQMGVAVMVYSLRPWMWFPPIWYLSGWANKYNSLLKTLTDFTKNVIQDRMEMLKAGEELSEVSRRKAFLDMLLEMKEENALTDEDIREEVDTFMFEGHDTTASGISWTIWCLATHPEIQAKVADEIYQIFGDSDRDITINDIKQMTYLELVLKESMRINPPVPFMGRQLRNDFKTGGLVAPKGSMIYISPLLIHRNPEVYPDPLRFDPDRFLPENAKQRHAYDYIPFSAGPRNCIGQKFAMYEEKIMLAWLIRRFKFSTDRDCNDNPRCPEMILRPAKGIPVRLERRQNY